MATQIQGPTDIEGVINAELEEISRRRGNSTEEDGRWEERCHKKEFLGISISGGGIRSATFALGVLQSLTEKCLLQKADYLSTVSGGGYIGSWLQGILKRPGDCQKPFEPLARRLPKPPKEDPITFLRSYSNYLSPRHGLSVDSLLIPVIWSRNMILNQAIIISAFLAVFLPSFLPGAGFMGFVSRPTANFSGDGLLILAALVGLVAVCFMAWNLSRVARREFSPSSVESRPSYGRDNSVFWVWLGVVLPIFIAVLIMMWGIFPAWVSAHGTGTAAGTRAGITSDEWTRIEIGGVLLFLLFAVLQWGGGFVSCYRAQRSGGRRSEDGVTGKNIDTNLAKARVHVVWMSAVSAGFTVLLVWAVTCLVGAWGPKDPQGSQEAIAWGVPLYVLALNAGIVLQIGLMGRDFPDASREWLARAGTLLWTTAVFWAGYFTVGVIAPRAIAAGWQSHGKSLTSAVVAWLGTTAATVLAGKSPKTNGASQGQKNGSTTLELLARFGPFVAIGGFLLAVAFGAQALLHHGVDELFEGTSYWDAFKKLTSCPTGLGATQLLAAFGEVNILWPLGLILGAASVFMVLSLRVNINEFSMHHFYKNRLVRCYLGASASARRRPDWFTGFDPKDDLPLKGLLDETAVQGGTSCPASQVPYPILNATMNVTAGTDLATQDRKGLSWIFTPLYSGFAPARPEEDAKSGQTSWPKTYAPTSQLSGGSGIALGTAMAISGAAANPNWGSHSAPQTAFLLTLFDVRLGWWVGNPEKSTFKRTGPRVALPWLIREMFGDLDEKSGYLNLSDGGHFENLGLYELVRRRCRYIIALDGEQDAEYRFESLGGAVRKCRADFGIDIVINPRPIELHEGLNHAHCVVGRIYYPENEYSNNYGHQTSGGHPKPGWLLYIKSSITGDEPADVEEYRREHPDFPQQSTADQFFTEAQFESYRMLGEHAGKSALDRYEPKEDQGLEEMFERLSARWETPPQAPEGAFTRQADVYAELMSRLADHPELGALDDAVVEGMPANMAEKDRMGFLFCLDLIQLAEDIFVDLNFADKHVWEHPTYAGWRRVFTYWAEKAPIKKVWKAQRESFGEAFRYFFDDLTEYKGKGKGFGED